jgi:lysophospholipase L1-like esterase
MSMRSWRHYVAFGDSFIEGVGDPVDGYASLGAIDRIAIALKQSNPELRYTNLGRRGVLLSQIRGEQLEPALILKPDFVSFVAGANDILRGRFNAARWEQEFRSMYEALTGIGAVVSTGNMTSFPVLRTFEEPFRTRILSNIAEGNEILQRLAERYQVILIDAWTITSRYDDADWSADGVHLNFRGYYRFAKEILKTIERRVGMNIGTIEEPPDLGPRH